MTNLSWVRELKREERESGEREERKEGREREKESSTREVWSCR